MSKIHWLDGTVSAEATQPGGPPRFIVQTEVVRGDPPLHWLICSDPADDRWRQQHEPENGWYGAGAKARCRAMAQRIANRETP